MLGRVGIAAAQLDADADVRIRYHEKLQALQFTTSLHTSQSAAVGDGEQPLAGRLTFRAFGRQYELVLASNARLVANLPAAQKNRLLADYQLYKGHIAGMEGSWVRLVQHGVQWTGLLWDGAELFAIESAARLAVATPLVG